MGKKYDFQKEWPKIKKELLRVSQEAVKLAKKSEKEFIKISKQGKLYIDSTALNFKKEHLYHLIGKEYVKAKCPATQSVQLKKLIDDLNEIDKQVAILKKKIKTKRRDVKSKSSKQGNKKS